jgi:PAS domain S-box-containing protein
MLKRLGGQVEEATGRPIEARVGDVAHVASDVFRLAVEASPIGQIMTDAAGKIVLVNAEAERLFGYQRDELIGKSVDILVPAAIRGVHGAHRANFEARPEARRMGAGRELFGVRKDGSEIPIEIGLNPIRTANGLMILSAIMDITERKIAEEKFRLAVEACPSGMIMTNAAGKIVMVNAEAERLFGYQREELIGQPIEMLVPESVRSLHGAHRSSFVARPEARRMGVGRDLYGVRKDGTQIPIEIGLNPIRTREGLLVLSAIADITERKLAEERFRIAVEASPSGMIMTDGSGKMLLVNAEAERLFGYRRDELLGRSIDMLVPAAIRPSHAGLRSGFSERPEARRMGAGRDLHGVRKDGSEIPIEIGLNPIRTSEGLLVLSAIADVSERKRTSEVLARRSEELQRSNAELEQFAYVASHDLQEPLRMVASYTELLGERYKGKLDERADKYISYAIDGAKRMQQLVKDLLAFSRVGTQGTAFKPTDSEIVVKSVLDVLKVAIAESGAEICCGDLPPVTADEVQLGQLFQNLIGNALKFRSDRSPRIDVGATHKAGEWIFHVKDNGIGIDRQYAERIFQMFQRLHERSKYDGSGIGLAIAKKIAERHGGRIWFESEPGEGTTFFFTLPDERPQGRRQAA